MHITSRLSLVCAMVVGLTACDNPFKSDDSSAESTPAEDNVAISNYIAQTTVNVDVSVPGDNNVVIIGSNNTGTRRNEDNSVVTTDSGDCGDIPVQVPEEPPASTNAASDSEVSPSQD